MIKAHALADQQAIRDLAAVVKKLPTLQDKELNKFFQEEVQEQVDDLSDYLLCWADSIVIPPDGNEL